MWWLREVGVEVGECREGINGARKTAQGNQSLIDCLISGTDWSWHSAILKLYIPTLEFPVHFCLLHIWSMSHPLLPLLSIPFSCTSFSSNKGCPCLSLGVLLTNRLHCHVSIPPGGGKISHCDAEQHRAEVLPSWTFTPWKVGKDRGVCPLLGVIHTRVVYIPTSFVVYMCY